MWRLQIMFVIRFQIVVNYKNVLTSTFIKITRLSIYVYINILILAINIVTKINIFYSSTLV